MKIHHFVIPIVVLMFASTSPAAAQTSRPAQCGDIIESEFTEDMQPQSYVVTMAPGDVIEVSAVPLGDTLKVALGVYAPNGDIIGLGGEDAYGDGVWPSTNPVIQTGVLSARGDYTITAYNARIWGGGNLDDDYRSGIGVYTLYIGCTLRDGTQIAPGDSPSAAPGGGTTGEATTVVAAPFAGVGFPGLAAKDFSDGVTIPFIVDAPNAGAINPGFESVFGFTLDASTGDKFDLTFTRTGGNMNLGLAVLAPDNRIVYQASLVNAEYMNGRFTFPGDGQYTIGVWKIELMPPDTPENTAFQLTGTLNP